MLITMIIILIVVAFFLYIAGLEAVLLIVVATVAGAIGFVLLILFATWRYIFIALLVLLVFYLINHYHLGILSNG